MIKMHVRKFKNGNINLKRDDETKYDFDVYNDDDIFRADLTFNIDENGFIILEDSSTGLTYSLQGYGWDDLLSLKRGLLVKLYPFTNEE